MNVPLSFGPLGKFFEKIVVGGLHFSSGRRKSGRFCFVWQKNVGVYGNEVPLRHFPF